MFSVRGLVGRLRIFEGDRVPLGLKVFGLAMYFQLGFYLSIAVFLRLLRERLDMASERRARRFIAVDETCVKVNGEHYWVYSALDIGDNELISMRVYPTRNSLTTA